MKTLATTISFCLITLWCLGQSDSAHHKVYFAIVEHKSGLIVKSMLYDVSDSSVYLPDKTGKFLDSVSYGDIEKIKIRRKGSVGVSLAVGAASGILLGALIGGVSYQPTPPTNNGWAWVTYTDPGPGASIAGGAFLGGLAGLITGAILGTIPHKTLKMHHDYKQFSASIPELKRYCLHY